LTEAVALLMSNFERQAAWRTTKQPLPNQP
jgi:hypothetical protein